MSELAEQKCAPCEGGVAPLKEARARVLLEKLHPDWQIATDGKSIRRDFAFSAFGRTMAFTNAVAWVATNEGHHPDMQVSYGRCVVVFTTHAIGGLSDNDFICAAKIDRLFADA